MTNLQLNDKVKIKEEAHLDEFIQGVAYQFKQALAVRASITGVSHFKGWDIDFMMVVTKNKTRKKQ